MNTIGINFNTANSLFANNANSEKAIPVNILEQINKRMAQKEDSVKLSISAKIAQEYKKVREEESLVAVAKEEEQGQEQATTAIDLIMADAIAEGQKIPKPNEEMDDLQWGMMVKLGKEMGLTDADAIASLTDKDVEYFYSAYVAESDRENYWKDVFITDENGAFVKENGETVRNPDFKGVSYLDGSVHLNKNLEMTGYSSSGEYIYPESMEETKLSSVSPEASL